MQQAKDQTGSAAGAARLRAIMATSLVAVTVLVAAVVYGVSPDGGLALFRHRPPSLADMIDQIVSQQGLDAALATYRTSRARRFTGVTERESDLNDLGYRYLGQGDSVNAIRIFEMNAETHPRSANVQDSLGEAYAASGQFGRAISAYRNAAALNPNLRSAAIALATLTGVPRAPYSMPLFVHVAAGAVALTLGFAAVFVRKGRRAHRLLGISFSLVMLCMCAAALVVAVDRSQVLNILAASLTVYLVATGWRSGARRSGDTGALDWALLTLALCVAASEIVLGLEAAGSAAGTKYDTGPALYLVFGTVLALCAVGDVRLLLRRGSASPQRIPRHLWRMCLALFIAAGSLFVGQEQVFPDALRATRVLTFLAFLPLILMIFWLIRLSGATGRKRTAALPVKHATDASTA